MRLIDADAFAEDVDKIPEGGYLSPHDLISLINARPTIERKTGKWIRGKCDQCGAHAPFWPMASTYYESDYCPNCGADMRGKQDGNA